MVYVTHDQVEAMTLADRIVVLDAGNVRQFGAPLDLYQHPKDKFVAGFIGSPKMNFLPCTIDGDRLTLPNGSTLPITAPKPGPRPTELGIRPEHLDVTGAGWAVTVETTELLGAERLIYGRLGQGSGQEQLIVRIEEGAQVPAPGSVIHVAPREDRIHHFDATTGKRL